MKESQQVDARLLGDLTQRIVDAVHPLRIILFGSAGQGMIGPDSDLDVLVVVPDGTHRRQTWRRICAKMWGFKMPTDIVVSTPSDITRHKDDPSLIYAAALSDGKEIYRAPA